MDSFEGKENQGNQMEDAEEENRTDQMEHDTMILFVEQWKLRSVLNQIDRFYFTTHQSILCM